MGNFKLRTGKREWRDGTFDKFGGVRSEARGRFLGGE